MYTGNQLTTILPVDFERWLYPVPFPSQLGLNLMFYLVPNHKLLIHHGNQQKDILHPD